MLLIINLGKGALVLTGSFAQRVQRVLVGGSGAGAAAFAWTAIVVLCVVAFMLDWILPFVAGLTSAAVILVNRLMSSWWLGRLIALASLAVWAICTLVVWWLWGVGFEAADAGQPAPAVMALYRPAFVLGAAVFSVFWVILFVGTIRTRRAIDRAQPVQ